MTFESGGELRAIFFSQPSGLQTPLFCHIFKLTMHVPFKRKMHQRDDKTYLKRFQMKAYFIYVSLQMK